MATPNPQIESSSDDRLWVLLGYIFTPLFPIIIMLMQDKKDRPFVKAHNMQALIFRVGDHCARDHHYRGDLWHWILHHHPFMDLPHLPGH